jgi:glycosyltransferase involved in cell wall biosynthesis
MTRYAIVVPAYNEEACLPATLAAARAAMAAVEGDFGRGELVVVDNNSSDRTAEAALAHGADRVVFEPHNQIARARNAGAAATEARWLVFLDADTLLPADLLRQALAALDSGTVAGGGARVAMDREVTPTVAWLVRTWDRASTALGYAAGSFFFARRDGFEAAGGFDESVYAGEEVWLARRLKAWAKSRELSFVVLRDPPVTTSGRKSDWYTGKDFILQVAVLLLLPGAARSRRLCRMWYRRPAEAEGEPVP